MIYFRISLKNLFKQALSRLSAIGVGVGIFLSLLSVAYAFEPVSIDEFFKKYPDERPVQPTISEKKSGQNVAPSVAIQKPNNTEVEIIDQDIPVTVQKYPQVEVLLLDRILGRSKIMTFTVGENKALNALFDVTISECLERKTEFNSVTQAVTMRVDGFADSKANTQKTVLYDDIFYIQMPGFKGFEHPIYDIRPMKCTGKPELIALDEPIIPKVVDVPQAEMKTSEPLKEDILKIQPPLETNKPIPEPQVKTEPNKVLIDKINIEKNTQDINPDGTSNVLGLPIEPAPLEKQVPKIPHKVPSGKTMLDGKMSEDAILENTIKDIISEEETKNPL